MKNVEILPFDKEYLISCADKMGFSLSNEQVLSLEKYYQILVDYNNKVNLTALTDPKEVAVKHFVDSLTRGRKNSRYWCGSRLSFCPRGNFPSRFRFNPYR